MNEKKRKHIRFQPEPLDMALISYDSRKNVEEFQAEDTALVLTESFGGAGIVVKKNHNYEIGEFLWVKIGKLQPLYAEVRWIKELDEHLLKVGLQYYESNQP